MLKNKPFWTIIGFLMMASGFLTLILSLVGLEWQPLLFIYSWGGAVAVVFQLILIVFGFAFLFISRNADE